jgi:hypothetical protein
MVLLSSLVDELAVCCGFGIRRPLGIYPGGLTARAVVVAVLRPAWSVRHRATALPWSGRKLASPGPPLGVAAPLDDPLDSVSAFDDPRISVEHGDDVEIVIARLGLRVVGEAIRGGVGRFGGFAINGRAKAVETLHAISHVSHVC